MRADSLTTCIICLATAWTLSACDGSTEHHLDPLVVPDVAVDSFGVLAGPSSSEVFSRLLAAALTGSGQFVLAADNAPPFIRVRDRTTGETWAFGERGQGPGEMSAPYGLSVLGDSLVLVLSDSRLASFDLSGEFREAWRMDELGLLAMDVAVACPDDIFLYGVPNDYPSLDSVPWLHRLAPSTLLVTPGLVIPGPAVAALRFGALEGVQGSDEGVVIWHRQGEFEASFWVPCDDGEVQVLSQTSSEIPLEERFRMGEVQVTALSLGDTLFRGAVGTRELLVDAYFVLEGPRDVTSLRITTPDGCHLSELAGSWTLFEWREGEVVLATDDPFPRLFIVPWSRIEEGAIDVECA